MRTRDPKPTFDPRSPVQPGRERAPYFIAAIAAAIAIWTLQQRAIEDTGQRPAQSAKGEIRTLFSSDDYPDEALQHGDQGKVQARLSINTHGRVTHCSIIRSSRHASLDNATCNILKRRAQFAPARDANGKAVPDSVVTPLITWLLAD
jgi:TonB family protein